MRFLVSFLLLSVLMTSANTEAKPRSFSKSDILKDISNWQDDIVDFEDLDDKGTQIRRDWLYRLQFLVERRYDGNEASLLRLLHFMLELDKPTGAQPKADDTAMIEGLLRAIEKVREPHEPLWLFIKSYVEDIDPKQPPSLDEFAKSRDYINNFQGISAKKMLPEDLEKLLQLLDQKG